MPNSLGPTFAVCVNWACISVIYAFLAWEWMNSRWACLMIMKWRLRKAPRWSESAPRFLEHAMSNRSLGRSVAFVGGGQMAEALIGGLLSAKLCEAEQIWATDPVVSRLDHLKKAFGIQVGVHNGKAVAWAD